MTVVIEYAVSLAAVLLSFMFFGAFFKKGFPLFRGYMYVTSAAAALSVFLLGKAEIKFGWVCAAAFACMTVIHLLYFKEKLYKILAAEALYYAVTAGAVFVSAVLLTEESVIQALVNSSHERAPILLTSCGILAFVCLALHKRSGQVEAKGSSWFYVISFAVLAVCTVIYFFQVYARPGNQGLAALKTGVIIIILGAAAYTCYSFFFKMQKSRQEAELYNRENELLKRSLKEQEITFSQWRKNIHDYKNTILAMDSLAEQGEYGKLSEFLSEEKQRFMHRAEYIRTGNSTADTVINTKLSVAKESGITFTVNARFPEQCRVSDIDLARILGNLLDNALEASQRESEAFIDMKVSAVGEMLIINIVNKCTAPPADTVTRKPDRHRHGIGLKSVRDTSEKYNGQFELAFEKGKAIATVMIPNT